ncbi:MAG: TetR/AcrR family transcriptional regulator [Clostridia bacterium]|nr:TetR/AcrR family transcriptional regulator [Clostridia bacterium]
MDITASHTTRERIINATLELIKKDGFQNVTVRKIASSANVNIASVNYHFGSKDAVITEALNHVTSAMINSFNILEVKNLAPELRLRKFLQDYSDVIQKYPDVIKNFISLIMNNCEIEIPYAHFLKDAGFTLIKNTIREIKPDEEESTVRMRTIQLLSCTGYPILMGNWLQEISSLDFNSQEQRYKYMELLLNNVIK